MARKESYRVRGDELFYVGVEALEKLKEHLASWESAELSEFRLYENAPVEAVVHATTPLTTETGEVLGFGSFHVLHYDGEKWVEV